MQPVHTVWVGRESAIHLSVILKMQPVQTYGLEVSIVVTSLLLIEDATRTYRLGWKMIIFVLIDSTNTFTFINTQYQI